jgi:iron complex outermembrane receptor protein
MSGLPGFLQRATAVCLSILIPALFLPTLSICFAEEPTNEELAFMEIEDVFAAAKHLQEIKDAPSAVTIVTDEEIARFGYRNLSDVLRNMRGFYVTNDRSYEFIGFRGISRLGDHGNLLLQLVDGHTYNESIYGSIFMGNELGLDIDLIKKIEIVRGPGSALFGSNALLGILNIIPKKGEDINGLYTKTEAGSYDTYKGAAIYGKKFENGLDVIVSAGALDSGGQDFFFKEFNGIAGDADGEKAFGGFTKLIYEELSLTAAGHLREKHVPTAAFGADFNDNRFETTDIRSFVEGKWEHRFLNGSELTARFYYDQYSFHARYPFEGQINKDRAYDDWVGSEVRYLQKIGKSHLASVGMEAAYHLRANQENFDVDPYRVLLDDRRTFGAWSAYAQDEWDVLPWMRLTGGARFDYFSLGEGHEHLSPRVGAIFKPMEDGTLKLLYGQSFRFPNLFELYYSDQGESAKANPNLRPETLDAYEIVWEQQLNPVVKSTLSAFRYEIHDLIITVEDPSTGVGQHRNLDLAVSNGIEAGLEFYWPSIFRGGLSYSFQEATDDATGKWLPNSPRHLVKMRGGVPLFKGKLFAAVLCRYMSERLTRDALTVNDVVVTDITFYTQNVFKRLNVSFGILNLFDEDYSDPVSSDHDQQSVLQNGRNFWVKASYLF